MEKAVLEGYRGDARGFLESIGAGIGDTVKVELDTGYTITGVVMPRYEHADDKHITLKLSNGYNIGVLVTRIRRAEILSKGGLTIGRGAAETRKTVRKTGNLIIIGTGGTIASRIDYRTGAVTSTLTPEDLYSKVPELRRIASIDTEVLFNILSENMTPRHWELLAERIGEAVKEGYKGIVVAHGTDTMHYTASALSFALENLPVPVVLVGAQRSSDRPSSDAATNLLGAAVTAAKADFSGVFVAMHSSLSDDVVAVHLGVKVRKNHTSRRDAFQSVNSKPAAYVDLRSLSIRKVLELPPRRNKSSEFRVKARFSDKAFLLKYFPGMDGSIIDFLVERGYKAIIIEGTGLGHVGRQIHENLRTALDNGVFIGMTSQCLWGRVRMTVYDTGRDLLRLGVTPLEDMLPETALVKAMWLLGNGASFEELKRYMPKNMRGEISSRTLIDY